MHDAVLVEARLDAMLTAELHSGRAEIGRVKSELTARAEALISRLERQLKQTMTAPPTHNAPAPQEAPAVKDASAPKEAAAVRGFPKWAYKGLFESPPTRKKTHKGAADGKRTKKAADKPADKPADKRTDKLADKGRAVQTTAAAGSTAVPHVAEPSKMPPELTPPSEHPASGRTRRLPSIRELHEEIAALDTAPSSVGGASAGGASAGGASAGGGSAPRPPKPLVPQYSMRSAATLQSLASLESEVHRMELAAGAAEEVLHHPPAAGVPPSLRSELAPLYGWAGRTLEGGIDATTTAELGSGRADAKAKKKELTAELDALLTRIHDLIAEIDGLKPTADGQGAQADAAGATEGTLV